MKKISDYWTDNVFPTMGVIHKLINKCLQHSDNPYDYTSVADVIRNNSQIQLTLDDLVRIGSLSLMKCDKLSTPSESYGKYIAINRDAQLILAIVFGFLASTVVIEFFNGGQIELVTLICNGIIIALITIAAILVVDVVYCGYKTRKFEENLRIIETKKEIKKELTEVVLGDE
jgi:hypothetical protein